MAQNKFLTLTHKIRECKISGFLGKRTGWREWIYGFNCIPGNHSSQLGRFRTYILPRLYKDSFHSELPIT